MNAKWQKMRKAPKTGCRAATHIARIRHSARLCACALVLLGSIAMPKIGYTAKTSSTKATSKIPEAPPPDPSLDFETRARKGKFSFEFAKAEIIDIVKAISDMTRRNFIIPDKLKGQRITILSPTKISASEAYQVFLTALAASGVTLVRTGKFYKLVNAKSSIQDTIPTCLDTKEPCPKYSDQMVTLILHLSHVEASQITSVIKPLASKSSSIATFQPTNALIISEFATNLTRLRRIISALDVPGFDDELRIVQIEYATASDIADKLTQIFEVQSSKSRGNGKNRRSSKKKSSDEGGEDDVSISKVLSDDRTNQLIIKANRRSFDAIRSLIGKLDVPISETDSGRIHVHYLENANAEELASTLSSLASGNSSSKSTPRRGATRGSSGSKRAESAVLFEGDVKITADKSTNSLIVVASPRDFRALKRLIEQLDVPRRQVYVEVAILEINVSNDDEFGLDWHAPAQFSDNDLGAGSIGFLQSAGGSPSLAALSSPTSLLGVAGGSLAGVIGEGISVPVGSSTLTLPSFGVLLRWLETASNAKILSTPHILSMDNEEATIEVGSRIPFQRGTALPQVANLAGGAAGGLAGLGGNLFSSTERIDVSLQLTIKPQINERGKIRMEIDQKLEDLDGVDERTGQPRTSNRAAKSVVVVDDQQTIVLGGLMKEREVRGETKIPFLGDIPFLGWFFRSQTTRSEQVNLLLVLTPYIVRTPQDFQRIFERKLAEHEEFSAEYYGERASYRAHIDYSRKSGPLAKLGARVAMEYDKIEYGGEGVDETLVSPESRPKADILFEPLTGDSKTESTSSSELLIGPKKVNVVDDPVVVSSPDAQGSKAAGSVVVLEGDG